MDGNPISIYLRAARALSWVLSWVFSWVLSWVLSQALAKLLAKPLASTRAEPLARNPRVAHASLALLAAVAAAPCAGVAVAGERAAEAAREEELPVKVAVCAELSAPVDIELDRVEIPTIRAATLEDAAAAEGWMHARERFLQMDLARREAAGELGELVPAAVSMDRPARLLGLRAVAERALAELPAAQRTLLERYCDGVNAQLTLTTPMEYRLLKVQPKPWLPADCVLVQLGMARYLDGSAQSDRARAALWRALPSEVARFLTSSSGALDMSVDGSPLPAPGAIPERSRFNLRAAKSSSRAGASSLRDTPAVEPRAILRGPSSEGPRVESGAGLFDRRLALHAESHRGGTELRQRDAEPWSDEHALVHPGSNAFAVAGTRTKDGRAVVANDMHLALMAPGIWYRVALEWIDTAGAPRKLLGLSLPGVPLVVQGTNGHVAWGFTNLTADLADVVLVERDPADPGRYLVPGGSEPFGEFRETFADGEALTRRTTRWGPVLETLPDGRMVAVRCATFEPGGIDFGLFDLALATTLEAGLDAARRWRGPPQNALFADADGRIGWTIAGTLPARGGERPTPAPLPWPEVPAWSGPLDADAKPTIVDPASGILTSGNQLSVAPSGALRSVLAIDEAAGDRAHRLRELLAARSDWTEAELHAVQLDVRSPRLLRWREAVLASVHPRTSPSETPQNDSPPSHPTPVSPTQPSGADASSGSARSVRASPPTSDDARAAILAWNGEVTTDASAPVVLDAFRAEFRAAFAGAVAEAYPTLGPSDVEAAVDDEALLRILEARTEHLCPDPEGWNAVASKCLARATARATESDNTLATRGARNRAAIRHPAADSLGAAARMAEMPRTPLPGHPTCVRVQTPQFGASQRSVVSPGRLEDAILVTPCGQSGMPMSPHFRSLHRPWQDGAAFPMVPGEATSKVRLVREAPSAQPPDGSPPEGSTAEASK